MPVTSICLSYTNIVNVASWSDFNMYMQSMFLANGLDYNPEISSAMI